MLSYTSTVICELYAFTAAECAGAAVRSATDEQLMRMDEKKLKDVKEESELHLGSASSS